MAWNGSDNNGRARTPAAPQKKSPSALRGVLAGVAVVAVAGVAFFLVFGRAQTPSAPQETKRKSTTIKAVTPAKPAPHVEEATPEDATLSENERKSKEWRAMLLKIAEQNPQLMFHLTNDASNVVKPTFRTSVEQVMDWIFNCVPGDDPLPLPDLSEESPKVIAEALISINKVTEDDTEETAQRKESVMLAKKELRQFIKDGGDFPEFMDYYRKQLVQYHKLWADAQKSVESAPADLSCEDMKQLVDKTNAMLAEKGLKPIEVNERVRDRLGLPDPDEDVQEQNEEVK